MASLRLTGLALALTLAVTACATAGKNDNQPADAPAADASLEVDANTCATQPCDILPQCGCDATSACDVDISDVMGTACRSVITNAKAEGGDCSGATSCQAGLVCLGNPGVCKKYCEADGECGQPRGKCAIQITDGTNIIPGIPKVCTSNCDPLNPAAGGCPAGMRCGLFTQQVNGQAVPVVDCDRAATSGGGQDAVCGNTTMGNDDMCNANHLCTQAGAGTTFVCRRICVVGGTGICSGANPNCIGFTTPFIVAGVTYGVCD